MFDRSSVDHPGAGPSSALENELRTALQERGASITTATLLRPDPPGLPEFSSRPPVTRWRIVGAVAAVSAVILAVVIGRGVVAPQQVQTATPQNPTVSSWVGFDSPYLTDHIWAATNIENRITRKSISTGSGFPVWNGMSGSLPMTVEFRSDGTIVFTDGGSHITGSYSIGGRADAPSVSVQGARLSEETTDARETAEMVSQNLNSLLLEGMPEPLELEADLVGDELTLSRGNTRIRFRAAGVTPAAAAAVGPVGYPIVAAVSGRWRPSEILVGGRTSSVPPASGATLALTPAGTFEIYSGSSMTRGRWWATPTGLVTADPVDTSTFRVSTGTTLQLDLNGLPSPQGETPVPVQKLLADFASGDVTVRVSDGGSLTVTDKRSPGTSLTLVRG